MFLAGCPSGRVCLLRRKAAIRKPIHALGSQVRVKASLIFCLLLAAAMAASSSEISSIESKPLTTTELAAWLTGGVSSRRLAQLVKERGLATLPTQQELRDLESAGAGKDLMAVVSSGNVLSAEIGPSIPAALLKASAEARAQRFHEAEVDLRGWTS